MIEIYQHIDASTEMARKNKVPFLPTEITINLLELLVKKIK